MNCPIIHNKTELYTTIEYYISILTMVSVSAPAAEAARRAIEARMNFMIDENGLIDVWRLKFMGPTIIDYMFVHVLYNSAS